MDPTDVSSGGTVHLQHLCKAPVFQTYASTARFLYRIPLLPGSKQLSDRDLRITGRPLAKAAGFSIIYQIRCFSIIKNLEKLYR